MLLTALAWSHVCDTLWHVQSSLWFTLHVRTLPGVCALTKTQRALMPCRLSVSCATATASSATNLVGCDAASSVPSTGVHSRLPAAASSGHRRDCCLLCPTGSVRRARHPSEPRSAAATRWVFGSASATVAACAHRCQCPSCYRASSFPAPAPMPCPLWAKRARGECRRPPGSRGQGAHACSKRALRTLPPTSMRNVCFLSLSDIPPVWMQPWGRKKTWRVSTN